MGEEEWKGQAMSDTPRTDEEILDPEIVHQDSHSEGWVSIDFARQLERELARCNNLYRKLDVRTLGLCDIIRELESELQRWKHYAHRLEEAGEEMHWWCADPQAVDKWDKTKEAKP